MMCISIFFVVFLDFRSLADVALSNDGDMVAVMQNDKQREMVKPHDTGDKITTDWISAISASAQVLGSVDISYPQPPRSNFANGLHEKATGLRMPLGIIGGRGLTVKCQQNLIGIGTFVFS
jgi:hypothetical protein